MTKQKTMSLSEFWDKYGIYCIIGSCLLGILLLYLFGRDQDYNYENTQYGSKKDYTKSKPRGPFESKGELLCKESAIYLFNKEFKKIRPNFLKNHQTKSNLEIDIYNDELKLGIEYSGRQHYEYTPYFHKDRKAFEDQLYRDKLKEEKCKEHGVNLIIVPYTIKPQHIRSFIRNEARKLGYNV
jgi:hypothetical protein